MIGETDSLSVTSGLQTFSTRRNRLSFCYQWITNFLHYQKQILFLLPVDYKLSPLSETDSLSVTSGLQTFSTIRNRFSFCYQWITNFLHYQKQILFLLPVDYKLSPLSETDSFSVTSGLQTFSTIRNRFSFCYQWITNFLHYQKQILFLLPVDYKLSPLSLVQCSNFRA